MYITLMIVFDVLFLICLAICAVTDRQYQIIPNHTILFMAALAFGRAALLMSQGQLMWPGLSILLLIVPLYLSWIKGGIGGGDVKMISAIMLYLGLTATIISLAISILIISIQRFVRPGRMLRRDLPCKNTFRIGPIRRLIEQEITDGVWIDPFANTSKIATVTNDLNPEFDTDYHLDALDFLKMFDDESVDGILYDPPYSPRQMAECYNNIGRTATAEDFRSKFWRLHKDEIARIVKPGGKVLSFGWNSGGMGKKNGFDIKRVLLVPHGGAHNDTICTVEVKARTVSKPTANANN